tara:strand:+ start:1931 stop:2533 length:603 start_codon:yes stop_codon:yes gene_type:complete
MSNEIQSNIKRSGNMDIFEATTLTYHQKLLLDDYLDKSFMMSVLCENTKNYYYRFGNILVIPTIFLSSILCVFNAASASIPAEKHYILSAMNISINAVIAFFSGLHSILQINDKYNQFQTLTTKFTKLEHHIENNITNYPNRLDENFIDDIIKSYDNLIDDIDFTFPDFIKKSIKAKYKDKRTMPNVLNGDKKPRLLQNI